MLTINSGAERAKCMHTAYVQRMYNTKWVNDIICPGIGFSFILLLFCEDKKRKKTIIEMLLVIYSNIDYLKIPEQVLDMLL